MTSLVGLTKQFTILNKITAEYLTFDGGEYSKHKQEQVLNYHFWINQTIAEAGNSEPEFMIKLITSNIKAGYPPATIDLNNASPDLDTVALELFKSVASDPKYTQIGNMQANPPVMESVLPWRLPTHIPATFLNGGTWVDVPAT